MPLDREEPAVQTPFYKTTLARLWIAVFSLVITLWLTLHYFDVFYQLFVIVFSAYIISLAIRPLAYRLGHWHIPFGLTTILVYGAVFVFLAVLIKLLVPVINADVQAYSTLNFTLPVGITQKTNGLNNLQTPIQQVAQHPSAIIQMLAKTVTNLGSFLIDVFVVVILSYFFVTTNGLPERWLMSILPQETSEIFSHKMLLLDKRLSHWIWAQFGIAVYFALAFGIGLTVIGIASPFTIGLIGGVLEIIPYVGGIVAVVLATVSSIPLGLHTTVLVLIYYAIVVFVETHIIAPNLFGKAAGVHPALALIATLTGAKLAGVTGVLFAVPILMILDTLFNE